MAQRAAGVKRPAAAAGAAPEAAGAEAKPSFAERLRKLSARVEEAKNAEQAVRPEEAKRRKLEALKRRRLEERRRQLREERAEAGKTQRQRDAEVVLHCVVAAVLDWKLQKVELRPEPLTEGTHYRSWLLDVGGEGRFVVRDLQDAGDALRQACGFSQAREYSFQAAAGRAGLSFLTPHHITEQGCMLLHRYNPSAQRCDKGFVTSNYRQVVDTIKKLHQMETTGLARFFPVNCFSDVEDLAHSVRLRKLPVPGNFDTLYQITMQWRELLGQNPVEQQREYVACHNDLHASNIFHVPSDSPDPLERQGRLLLADFEQAGLGDRYWDLARFSRLNQFSNDEDVLLMKYYFGTYRERQMAVLKLLQAVSDFRDALWATLAAELLPGHPRAGAWPQEAVALMQRFEARAMDQDFVMYIGQELCG